MYNMVSKETNREAVVRIGLKDLTNLKNRGYSGSNNGNVRICLHRDIKDLLQEMIVFHSRDFLVRPHKHPKKSESFFIIEGSCLLVVFNESGKIREKVILGGGKVSSSIICRVPKNTWHSVFPLTDYIIFYEVKNGPFVKDKDSTFADWKIDKTKLSVKTTLK